MINISRIDLNLFVVFDAIYTERGVTRASDALKLSQSAISHSLAKLRDLLGDALFIREGNSITPTAVADQLIGPVRKALGEIQESLSQLYKFNPEASPHEFRVGMASLLESSTMPALIATIRQSAPDIRISAIHHSRAMFQDQLTLKALDAVVDVFLPHSPAISHRFLDPGKMVVIARQGHPAVSSGRITMQAYLEQDHVVANSPRVDQAIEDHELSRLGFQRRIKMRCQHHWTACKVICTSDMLLTMPERSARATNKMLGNQIVPFPIDMPAPDIYLYWRASAEDDPANRWLREKIYASFQMNE